jgi:hypothetical protein
VCGQRVGAALLQPCSLPCPHVLLTFNVPPVARLAGAWCQLVVKHLRDTHTPRRVTMMATLRGYLFTLIARRPLDLQGTRDGPGAAPVWAAGAGTAGHVAAPELPRAGQRDLEP